MSAATLAPTPASQPSTSSAASASSHIDNAGAIQQNEGLQAPDISSPHQLIDWVDTVLGQLETRFDDMNGQVTARSEHHSDLVIGGDAEIDKTDDDADRFFCGTTLQ